MTEAHLNKKNFRVGDKVEYDEDGKYGPFNQPTTVFGEIVKIDKNENLFTINIDYNKTITNGEILPSSVMFRGDCRNLRHTLILGC